MEESIFNQLGGFVVVRKVVVEFYNNVLNEDELAKFFAHTNMERQIDHQTKFISQLLGGPASFTDEYLKKIHARMGISDLHFDMIKDILCETLEDFELKEEYVEFVGGEFESRRNIIVTV